MKPGHSTTDFMIDISKSGDILHSYHNLLFQRITLCMHDLTCFRVVGERYVMICTKCHLFSKMLLAPYIIYVAGYHDEKDTQGLNYKSVHHCYKQTDLLQ